MKNTSVSARTPSDVTNRLEISGVCISDIINTALFKASKNIPLLEKNILKKKEELIEIEKLLSKLKEERKILIPKLKQFFKETRPLYEKNKNILSARIKILYNEFNIPTTEDEFLNMMEKYTK